MNATSLFELRNGAVVRDPSDEKMDQIRELLIGEYARHSDTRIAALEAKLQALERDVAQRLDAMSARIEALAGSTDADRRSNFEELARGMVDLGERMRRLTRG